MAKQELQSTDNGADSMDIINENFTEVYTSKDALETVVNPASSSSPASLDLAEDTDNGTNKITITAPSAVASDKVITLPDETGTIVLGSGWAPVLDAWTYASADSPTFTITVPAGAASLYSPGMRIRLTQTTVKYFIITAVADTVLTVYGGTDYTLVNAAISAISYSTQKAPLGFPLSPTKWTVEVTDTTERIQTTPTQNVWYNLGSLTISIPIGIWDVNYQVCFNIDMVSGEYVDGGTTLSTANNSESDIQFSTRVETTGATSGLGITSTLNRDKTLTIASKTSYYLNSRTILAGMSNLRNFNNSSTAIIRAVCAYL